MKKYITPEVQITLASTINLIANSGDFEGEYGELNTKEFNTFFDDEEELENSSSYSPYTKTKK